jgi:Tfp pilus assembly protein PilN
MSAPNELSFLPEDYLEQKYTRRANVVCVLLFLLTGGGIAAGWNWMRGSNTRIEATFAEVDAKYTDAARKIEQVKKMHEKQRDVVHHAELAASLVEKVPRSNILAEITNALPTGVSLLDLSMRSQLRQGGSASTAAPAANSFAQHKAAIEGQNQPAPPPQVDVKINITGIAADDVQVAQLMGRLGKSALFQKVNLIISDVYTPAGSPTDSSKGDKGPKLRRWQIDMMLNPQAEVREDTKTAAVELTK